MTAPLLLILEKKCGDLSPLFYYRRTDMNRKQMIDRLKDSSNQWDFIVIGGGASGLGTALDAASRGYRTLLLEQGDFAQGTSSRSTKLLHGGVRYLRQGRLSLVREALHERAILLQNAPHLVRCQPFIMPTSNWFSRLYYQAGIKLYDALSGKLSFGKSSVLSMPKLVQHIPILNLDKVKGGIRYFDGQFDDARLAINLAQTLVEQGGVAINYMRVQGLVKTQGKVAGVIAQDIESGTEYEILSNVVVNATGVFIDSIRQMDDKSVSASVVPSQGAHIVLNRSFFPSEDALIIPQTEDDRVLFIIPWYNRVLVGTTDTPLEKITIEPKPKKQEIEYLLENVGRYLTTHPTKEDILSTFAGIRPLVKPKNGWKSTAALSRDYVLMISDSQLISLTGGKWTTYRKMGEETVNAALRTIKLPYRPSKTKELPIHGYVKNQNGPSEWQYYGSDLRQVEQLGENHPELKEKLHPDLPCRGIDVVWAVRQEMAQTVEDVLSRRSRSLLLDAQASLNIAPKVAALMARELGQNSEWEREQIIAFQNIAKSYLANSTPFVRKRSQEPGVRSQEPSEEKH
jgi:glycerol-3-phosphate dehydrogenase